jgi:hypothetical protein
MKGLTCTIRLVMNANSIWFAHEDVASPFKMRNQRRQSPSRLGSINDNHTSKKCLVYVPFGGERVRRRHESSFIVGGLKNQWSSPGRCGTLCAKSRGFGFSQQALVPLLFASTKRKRLFVAQHSCLSCLLRIAAMRTQQPPPLEHDEKKEPKKRRDREYDFIRSTKA